jgi:hypothetical protein
VKRPAALLCGCGIGGCRLLRDVLVRVLQLSHKGLDKLTMQMGCKC